MLGKFDFLLLVNWFLISSLVTAQPTKSEEKEVSKSIDSINCPPHISVIAGGWDGKKPLRSVEIFDMDKRVILPGADMLMDRTDAGYALFQDKFYVVGGRITGGTYQDTASMEYYDPSTDQWTFGKCMSTSRSRLGVAVLNDYLYALGGYDGNAALDIIEVYDPNRDEWSQLSHSMPYKTEMFGIAVLHNQIYVIGGRGQDGNLKRVQIYNPKTDKWTFAPDLTENRFGPGIGVVNDQIYVMGGLANVRGNDYEKTVECYDLKTGNWSLAESLNIKRAFFSVIEYENVLYAVGGKNNTVHDISSIEMYHPSTKTVTTLPQTLRRGRSGQAAALIHKPRAAM